MTGPTFGEFAAAATWHLRELRTHGTGLRATVEPDAAAQTVADVRTAVHALRSYADDASAALTAAGTADDRSLGVWIRAARTAQQELATADTAWPDDSIPARSMAQAWSAGHAVSGLRAAVRYMTLGRDLLHTHLTSRLGLAETDWTPVVTSAPTACALLQLVGAWARQIAPHAGHLAANGCHITPAEQLSLNATSRALWITTWAVGTAQEHRPICSSELELLGAIPLAGSPSARLPARDATVPELCDGIIGTAQRLRAATRRAATEAAWSPALTRESLRQTAGCCAITASNLRIILRSLAEHCDRAFTPIRTAFASAAEAADSARAKWLSIAGAWDSITTDTHGYRSPAAAEAAALALWTGRLAYSSPDWTPALGPQHAPRPAAGLAKDLEQLGRVVEALHQASQTLAVVAEAERTQVRTASLHGRLIVPTRSLPDSFDVPYRFAPAPGIRTGPLLSSYDQALAASEHATGALTRVAAEIHAPVRTARLRPARVPSVGTVAEADRRAARQHLAAAVQNSQPAPAAHPQSVGNGLEPLPPGPVERVLIDLNISSRTDLEQAAALDTAAEQLILRAAASASRAQPGRDLARSAGTAELIAHLLVASDGTIPAALKPTDRTAVAQHSSARNEHAHRHASRPLIRQPEAEAGA